MIANTIPSEIKMLPNIYGLRRKPNFVMEEFSDLALYALNNCVVTSAAKAIVVDLRYAVLAVSIVSPNVQPKRYRFHIKMPRTTMLINAPIYAKRLMNPLFMMCLFWSLGGLFIMSFSVGSIPNASAGRMSVPTLTARIRTAVIGVGRFARIATKTTMSSPMLHENI